VRDCPENIRKKKTEFRLKQSCLTMKFSSFVTDTVDRFIDYLQLLAVLSSQFQGLGWTLGLPHIAPVARLFDQARIPALLIARAERLGPTKNAA
jgi:hypothetical protein